ncbi:MAG: hypothetical protein K9M02_19665 [Thiohalocapsa sp.]|nr:hypothetical protein [Thiohalocapsa sp.]
MHTPKRPPALGLFGTVLGLLSLLVAIAHFYFGPIEEPEPVENFIAEKTVSIKNAISAKLKGEEYLPPQRETEQDVDQWVAKGAMIAALTALSLGVLGFLRREEYLPCGLAIGLGGATAVFSVSVLLAGAIVAAIIIGAVIVSLGSGSWLGPDL